MGIYTGLFINRLKTFPSVPSLLTFCVCFAINGCWILSCAFPEFIEMIMEFLFFCLWIRWRHLLLERKAMTNLDSIFKSRDITLPTKVHIVKDMIFPVVVYGCESWTIKKAESWRTDAFELWCWRRLLRVPWTARRSNSQLKGNQSWIFIGRTDAKAQAPILWPDAKRPTHWKRPWCWERLKAKGEGSSREWDG